MPLAAAYTGARREEISALSLRDVSKKVVLPFINVAENGNRGGKTPAGERRVPVPDWLIALGFLDHIRALRRKKASDLFPELKPKGHVNGPPKKFGATRHHNESVLKRPHAASLSLSLTLAGAVTAPTIWPSMVIRQTS